MFSNIDNVNILTGVLASHGVRRVVVCPGSRNAPIVHNFNEAKGITCYPVTDERSAGLWLWASLSVILLHVPIR